MSSAGAASALRNCAPRPARPSPRRRAGTSRVHSAGSGSGWDGPRLFSLERLTRLVCGPRSGPRRPGGGRSRQPGHQPRATSPGPPHSQTIALFSVQLSGSVTASSSGPDPREPSLGSANWFSVESGSNSSGSVCGPDCCCRSALQAVAWKQPYSKVLCTNTSLFTKTGPGQDLARGPSGADPWPKPVVSALCPVPLPGFHVTQLSPVTRAGNPYLLLKWREAQGREEGLPRLGLRFVWAGCGDWIRCSHSGPTRGASCMHRGGGRDRQRAWSQGHHRAGGPRLRLSGPGKRGPALRKPFELGSFCSPLPETPRLVQPRRGPRAFEPLASSPGPAGSAPGAGESLLGGESGDSLAAPNLCDFDQTGGLSSVKQGQLYWPDRFPVRS